MFQGLVSIISQQEIMPEIFFMQIESPEIASVSKPGQFVMISSDSGCERLLRRPISINQVWENRVDFLYAAVGDGTKWLAQRKAGEKIDVLGPMGNGFTIDTKSRNILLVAGGMGIAPLRYMAQDALKRGKSLTLLEGAKKASILLPERLLPEGIQRIITTEDGSAGIKGMVTDLLAEKAESADQIFICGPLSMYKAINNNYSNCLKGKSVQVSLETRMGCGLGFCYACTLKTQQGLRQVCKDGPVFYWQDVIWDELI